MNRAALGSTDDRPPDLSVGRPFIRTMVWGVLLLDLVLALLTGLFLVSSRGQYLSRLQRDAGNLAKVLQKNLQATVQQVDLVLMAVKDQAEAPHQGDPRTRVQDSILAQFPRLAMADALRVTDASGVVILGTSIDRIDVRGGIGDRDYFLHHRDHPDGGLFVSRPVVSRFTGKWVLVLARRLNGPDGRFAGIVYATLPLENLGQLMGQVDVGRRGSVSLRGPDQALLARHPEMPSKKLPVGETRLEGIHLQTVLSGASAAHFTTHSRLDGEVRSYAFRRLANPTFFVLVGLSHDEALLPWRREVLLGSSSVIGLVILSVGLALLARAAWQRQMRAQAERERLIQDLTRALAEVKNLEGMLPICGHCKKIRDDKGYWNHLESYISEHSDATFTHGVCPDCAQELRREFLAQREPADRG